MCRCAGVDIPSIVVVKRVFCSSMIQSLFSSGTAPEYFYRRHLSCSKYQERVCMVVSYLTELLWMIRIFVYVKDSQGPKWAGDDGPSLFHIKRSMHPCCCIIPNHQPMDATREAMHFCGTAVCRVDVIIFMCVCVCVSQVLAKHATLAEAVDDICSAMTKKKEDPVRFKNAWQLAASRLSMAVGRCNPGVDQ